MVTYGSIELLYLSLSISRGILMFSRKNQTIHAIAAPDKICPDTLMNIFLTAKSRIIRKISGKIEIIKSVFSDLNIATEIIGKITPKADAVRSTK